MIAILDACTIINLLLSVNDVKYISYSEKVFSEVLINEKVYNEIKSNYSDNVIDDDFEEECKRIIFSYLNNFTRYKDDKDTIDFVMESLAYKKHNGELLSISQALF